MLMDRAKGEVEGMNAFRHPASQVMQAHLRKVLRVVLHQRAVSHLKVLHKKITL